MMEREAEPYPRPAAASTADLRHWNSSMLYLFGGLAAMLALIAASLALLVCSFRKLRRDMRLASPATAHAARAVPLHYLDTRDAEACKGAVRRGSIDEEEPKIVVIMAGDEAPRFLAKPCDDPRTHHHESDVARVDGGQ